MKLVVALALAPVASALVAPSAPAAAKTVMADAKSDLVDLQNSIPGPPGFYDPLGLSDMSFALGMQGNADGGVGQEVLPRRRISPSRGAAAPSSPTAGTSEARRRSRGPRGPAPAFRRRPAPGGASDQKQTRAARPRRWRR